MDDEDLKLAHYIEIGAVEIEGVDEDGDIIFLVTEKAKEIAPELWESHREHIDNTLIELYEMDLIDVSYDENLEAHIKLKPEGYKVAKELGLIPIDAEEYIEEGE